MRRVAGLDNLKILVTGGGGFIGEHLCRHLRDSGSEVHATSRKQRDATDDTGPIWWRADMADFTDARRILSAVKPDIVYHLSGAVGASPDLELVLPTYQSLLTSVVNMLVLATETGCRRIVLAASLTEPSASFAESTPQSPYAAAKWAAGGYSRMFHSLYQTPVAILRPFMTYGPGQATSKLIPSVTLSLLRGESPKLSSGRLKADWVYIADVIDGFLLAATAPNIDGRTIELGSGALVSISDIVDQLIALTGTNIKPLFGVLPDRPGEQERAADTATASELLGWRATTALTSGLRQTVNWFRAEMKVRQGKNCG